MAIQKIFAYNTGSLISGTTQVGDIAISEADVEYSANFGGLQWWGGPDETNGYVIAHSDPSRVPDYLGFWRSSGLTDSDFLTLCNSIPPRIGDTPFTNTDEAYTWLNSNGYWTSYVVSVTGYGYNLIATPYNFPELGNSIMNNPGDNTSGSTEINLLSTTGRGFYFNSFDSSSADTRNYFSGFTGQSVTITFSQTGNTAIYSGDTNAFKYWESSPTDNGFVFGTGIGTPPTNIPSGTAVLIQSATTNYTIGIPVYVSLVVN